MTKYNVASWNIEQFQRYAYDMAAEINVEIRNLENEMRNLASQSFRKEDDIRNLMVLAEEKPEQVIFYLRSHPDRLGDLKGGLFSSQERELAKERAVELSDLVRAREDKLVVRNRYYDMHEKCIERWSHLIGEAREQAHGAACVEMEYCDTTRSVRANEDNDRRSRWVRQPEQEPERVVERHSQEAARHDDKSDWYRWVNRPTIQKTADAREARERPAVFEQEHSVERQAIVNNSRRIGPPEVDDRNNPTSEWLERRDRFLREEEERIRGAR